MALMTGSGRGFIIGEIDFKFVGERAVANFPVAFNQDKKNEQTGQWEKDKSAVIRCAAWGELAEFIKNNFAAKQEIDLTGVFHIRMYEKDGQERQSAELTVKTVGAPVVKRAQGGQQSGSDPWASKPNSGGY